MKIASTLIGIVASLALLSPLKASTISRQGHVQANGITIAYEILGKGDRETILPNRWNRNATHRLAHRYSAAEIGFVL